MWDKKKKNCYLAIYLSERTLNSRTTETLKMLKLTGNVFPRTQATADCTGFPAEIQWLLLILQYGWADRNRISFLRVQGKELQLTEQTGHCHVSGAEQDSSLATVQNLPAHHQHLRQCWLCFHTSKSLDQPAQCGCSTWCTSGEGKKRRNISEDPQIRTSGLVLCNLVQDYFFCLG